MWTADFLSILWFVNLYIKTEHNWNQGTTTHCTIVLIVHRARAMDIWYWNTLAWAPPPTEMDSSPTPGFIALSLIRALPSQLWLNFIGVKTWTVKWRDKILRSETIARQKVNYRKDYDWIIIIEFKLSCGEFWAVINLSLSYPKPLLRAWYKWLVSGLFYTWMLHRMALFQFRNVIICLTIYSKYLP